MRSLFCRVLTIFALVLLFAGTGQAQYQPSGMHIYPESVPQGGCYTFYGDNASNMTIDIQLTDPVDSGTVTVAPWITLDSNASAHLCTDIAQPLGVYQITAIRNTLRTDWYYDSTSITVTPFDPSSLSIDPSSGYAGLVCKTLTFGDGVNMTIDMLFTFSSENDENVYEWGTHELDTSGQWGPNCDDHWTPPQTLTVRAIKNAIGDNWIYLDPYVTWTVLPPQPTSLSFSPTTAYRSGSYTWAAGNAGDVTLDVQLSENGGSPWTGTGVVTFDSGDPTAHVTTSVPSNQTLGTYHVTDIRNTLNTGWVNVSSGSATTVKVCPQGPGTTTVSPSTGVAGTSVSVTISAPDIYCSVSLAQVSGSGTGITFSGLTDPSTPVTSIAATFILDSSASIGTHSLRLSAGNDHYDFNFTVASATTITGISPNTGMRGTSGTMTISGSGFTGLTPSGNNGLTVSGTPTNDTSISASYSISCTATVGTATVTVGSATASFTVTNVSTPTITGISPSSGVQGTSPSVTFTGTNLCDAHFSAGGWSGLSVATTGTPTNTSATAAFTISSSATVGSPTITLTNVASLTATTSFSILGTPTISGSPSPSSGTRGTSGTLTISGANLSGATASGSNGVTVSVTSTSDSSISANYSISCTATLGSATITVTNHGISPTTTFTVNNVSTPTLSTPSPSSSGQANATVTVSGTNLCGATFSLPTAWSGLSVAVSGTPTYSSATAAFTISSTAAVGTPTIRVTNAAGYADMSFTILNTLSWAQDYIRDGTGVTIAIARPTPSNTTAPSTPGSFAVTSTSTTATVSWAASSASGGADIVGYKIYRKINGGANLPVGAVTANQTPLQFIDTTVQTGHSYTYTYTAVAVNEADIYSAPTTGIDANP